MVHKKGFCYPPLSITSHPGTNKLIHCRVQMLLTASSAHWITFQHSPGCTEQSYYMSVHISVVQFVLQQVCCAAAEQCSWSKYSQYPSLPLNAICQESSTFIIIAAAFKSLCHRHHRTNKAVCASCLTKKRLARQIGPNSDPTCRWQRIRANSAARRAELLMNFWQIVGHRLASIITRLNIYFCLSGLVPKTPTLH